jgi:hypothetical protein
MKSFDSRMIAFLGAAKALGARALRALVHPRVLVPVGAMAVMLFVVAPPAAAAPFDGLAQAVEDSAKKWAIGLAALGTVVLGAKILLGSHGTGESLQKWIIGTVLLVLGAAGGTALISLLQSYAR